MKRSELYELVWSEPAINAAARFGVSGSALAKACRKHNIPLPGRGHWSKLAAGKPSPRTPLPPSDVDEEIQLGVRAGQSRDRDWLIPGLLRAPAASTSKRRTPARPQVARDAKKAASPSHHPTAQTGAGPFEANAALDAECARALALANDYRRARSVAELFSAIAALAALEEDAAAGHLILTWVHAVRERLERDDPVAGLLTSLRKISEGSQRPAWWPTPR